MDTKVLKEKFGGELFLGSNRHHPGSSSRTKKEVKEEVRKRIDDLGPEGYILTSVHDIQPDVPPKNVITMFEEARNYGVFLSH